MSGDPSVSIILPAKNEAENLQSLLPRLKAMAAGLKRVVDFAYSTLGPLTSSRRQEAAAAEE